MESVAVGISRLIEQTLEVRGVCPECNGALYGWKTKNKDGSDRCAPTCMVCGYYALKLKVDADTNRRYETSLKKKNHDLFKYRSVISDNALFSKSLDNYQTKEEETATAMTHAIDFIKEVLNGQPMHMVLSGKSGVGKSHLCMAVCWAILEDSKYSKRVLFINYRELLERRKASFNDQLEAKNQLALLQDIKTVDFVVIDDLGAELGGNGIKDSTSFNNDVLYSILEARQNKALMVNTNLTSDEIKKAYGERILSRILKNAMHYSMQFKKTTDKRITGVR